MIPRDTSLSSSARSRFTLPSATPSPRCTCSKASLVSPSLPPHAENKQALFSLPEATPGLVLRAGQLLKAAGHADAAVEIYEYFIAGLQRHALVPVNISLPGSPTDKDDTSMKLLLSLPVRSHPERYSLA